jgi:MoaA/NifB/PqqE/SkfB family radical SAM enzyme
MAHDIRPDSLHIEANASCQLRCPGCPTTGSGYPPVIGSGYLRFSDFKNLLTDYPRFRKAYFENRGEMFLNPELIQILNYAYRNGISVSSESGVNLNFVHDGVLEALVKYRFKSLTCSIDGATAGSYQTYRVGGDFDRVIENIRTINHYKETFRSPYPELTWQFVVFGHNEHELPLAKQMAQKLNMKFSPKMAWDSEYSPIRDKAFVMAETGWPAVTREEYECATGHSYVQHVCYALWLSPRVNWDGKILGCCWNSWGDFGGNAFQDGYLPAINNEKITHAREMLLGRLEPIEGIPCTICELYIKRRERKRHLTLNEIYRTRRLWYRAGRFAFHLSRRLRGLKGLLQSKIPGK